MLVVRLYHEDPAAGSSPSEFHYGPAPYLPAVPVPDTSPMPLDLGTCLL
jgi:hypothetical protein